MTAEVPVQPTLPRRKAGISGRAIATGVALTIGASSLGIAGYAALNNEKKHDQDPLPSQPAIVIPSPEPIDTTKPTVRIPSPTPTSEPTPTPEPTLRPTENLSALEKTLNNWLDGSYKMPDLFIQSWDQKPAPLNIGFTDINKFEKFDLNKTSFSFQGILLAEQVVDNHLIIYVGQQDSQGNRYYFPMNVGNLKDFVNHPIAQASYYSDGNIRNSVFYPAGKTEEIMSKNIGKSFMFGIVSMPIPADTTIPAGIGLDEIKSQIPFSQDFLGFSVSSASNSSYENAKNSDKFRALLNNVITKVDAKHLPFANLLMVRNIK